MTKKVLISFGQLRKLCSPDNCRPPNDDYLAAIMGTRMSKWFDSQPPAPQWVRVEDELPDYNITVLIKAQDGVYVAQYRKGRVLSDSFVLIFGDMDDGTLGENATHWMPIPNLPEVGE